MTIASPAPPGARVLSRPVDEFRGLARALERVAVPNFGLDFDPAGVYLYGSVVRAFWSRERPRNVNVAFAAPEARATYLRAPRRSAEVAVAGPLYDSVHDLLDAADFTVDQVAYHDGRIYYAERFFEHLAQRLLVVNRIDGESAPRAFLRVYKFIARGYTATTAEVARIVSELPRGTGVFDGLDVAFHTDGTLLTA